MGGFAWVTLATNDSYSLGALVLAHSLRRVNTAHQLVVLITPGVTEAMKTQLSAVFNVVKVVDVLDSKDADNLALLARPELGITFTKLHCWRLTQYDKCVFLDADTLVLQNCDELFDREEFSAAPDSGWPDCFNSGVFVYKPSNDTFKALIEFALIHGSFDGGDQGLLNLFFSDWPTKDIKKHLPFIYNMVSTASYSYLPAFKQFGQGLKIIHFIGPAKPWLQPFNTETGLARVSGESHHISQFVQFWWDLFCSHIHPSLSTEMAGLAGALASVRLGAPLTAEQSALEEHLRRQGWEQGNIDYMGKDSFSNIWQKICDTLSSGPQPYLPPTPAASTEEAPAPVAPVAAPVYVSSVEISPTGPIDTSPPASYAPVSAPKPTVVASDSEVATNAALSETKTVPAEPKSPSVPELVSTDGSKSATKETSSQPPSDTPVSSAPLAIVTATALETSAPGPAVVTPASTASSPPTDSSTIAQTITSAPLDPAPVPPSPVIPLPATVTELLSQAPVTPAPVTSTPTELLSQAPVTPAPVTSTPASSTPIPLPSPPTDQSAKDPVTTIPAPETPIPVTTMPVVPTPATPVPFTPVDPVPSTPVSAPLTPVTTPSTPVAVAPMPDILTPSAPVSAPLCPIPPSPLSSPAVCTEVPLLATPVVPPEAAAVKESPTSTPVALEKSLVAAPETPISPPLTPSPLTPLPDINIPIVPHATPVPAAPSPDIPSATAATAAPIQKDSTSTDKIVTATPTVQPESCPVPTPPTPVPDAKVATPFETITSDAPVCILAPTPTVPSDTATTTPVLPAPVVTEKLAPIAPEGSPAKTEPAVITSSEPTSPAPVQPQTPTVTEPTPPTSPAATSVDASLVAKLQVDTEVPATPPVGTSSAAPTLASEEPPVPPKRKGGAKDSKNNKGGKPSKGKK